MRDLFGALRRRRGNNEAEVRPSLHPLVMGDRQEVLQPLHVGPRPGDLPSPADADGVVKMAAPQPPYFFAFFEVHHAEHTYVGRR